MPSDDLQYWISEVALARAELGAAQQNQRLADAAVANRTIDVKRAEAALSAQLDREIANA